MSVFDPEPFHERCEAALMALATAEPLKAPGWVYFIQPVGGGPIKIGYTSGYSGNHVGRRLAGLQGSSPVRLKVLGSFRSNTDNERALHRVFASDRLHGEWFRATPALHELIDLLDMDAEKAIDWAGELDEAELLADREAAGLLEGRVFADVEGRPGVAQVRPKEASRD